MTFSRNWVVKVQRLDRMPSNLSGNGILFMVYAGAGVLAVVVAMTCAKALATLRASASSVWSRHIATSVADRLTKIAYFILLKTGVTAVELAQGFWQLIWKLHGLLDKIIIDRDMKIIFLFYQKLIDLMGIISKIRTAFHP